MLHCSSPSSSSSSSSPPPVHSELSPPLATGSSISWSEPSALVSTRPTKPAPKPSPGPPSPSPSLVPDVSDEPDGPSIGPSTTSDPDTGGGTSSPGGGGGGGGGGDGGGGGGGGVPSRMFTVLNSDCSLDRKST